MDKELFEDLLGKEAGEVLGDALNKHSELMTPVEIEAIRQLQEDREGLSESHKESLNDLVMAISDDFTVRRRASMLKKMMTPPIPEDEDWIPEDSEQELDVEKPPDQPKRGGDEETLEDFLKNMDLDDD